MGQCDIALIGLGVMGQNLALNMESKGFRVAVYNLSAKVVEAFMEGRAQGKNIEGYVELMDLVGALKRPRRIMLMVKAGAPVDSVIDSLVSLLEPGDLIIDGGNSHFKDTIRRAQRLREQGVLYLGTGVSGGEEGALKGPSIMPGGSKRAYRLAADILEGIAAHVDGEPCCGYIGPEGAGHFVKTVHNGIEYGDMQLICEAYDLMRRVLGMDAKAMSEAFSAWNEGELNSYLIEITADILRRKDPETDKPIVDVILDRAGQKGTGKWTAQEALDLGVPASMLAEAVFARCMSARKDVRLKMAGIFGRPDKAQNVEREELLDGLGKAMYAAKICSYAQGFDVMQEASDFYEWDLNLGNIALLWRGGCIIRAQFLDRIKEAYRLNPKLENLMMDPYFENIMKQNEAALRQVVVLAAEAGVSVPSFSAALTYFDGIRCERWPHNLLQAQRDYFGAHTYERVDREGHFHTDWEA
ncbi:NADP-dependent phosphogluconate dehydrogenase [Gehongia tenuis]|uniref:6-phosphogluconate dehydrogenase, decarboxylating n=1 Tax=Gehongia tenuis TaxID=2763655 RepID=A0A926D734_9FIRM|nr:NADP-dependent phosphogluconate dehydrogenase [Gehongia tenuis]MBC8531570.1 NADP-dependent phosphogluconate dehydrogenase [Gehongia tenuis]